MHAQHEEFLNTYTPVVGRTSAEIEMPTGLWPRETRDKLAMTTLFLSVPAALLFETLAIVPNFLDAFTPEWAAHAALAAFLVANLCLNIYKVLTTDASGRGADLPHVLRPGWRYCFRCELNSPPRSYHCPMCEVCVLKRDHHCSFVGSCIGYNNHRYYVLSCLYAWVSSVYAMWWHWSFVWAELGGVTAHSVAAVVVPHLLLFAQQISFWQFALAGIQMGFVVSFLLSSYLLAVQLFCIARGQTQVEYREGIRAYDLGPWRNVTEVLGSRWVFSAFCPLLPSPLSGDGLNFPTRDLLPEQQKDL